MSQSKTTRLLALLLLGLMSLPSGAQQWIDPTEAEDFCPVQRRLTDDGGLYEQAGPGSGSEGLLLEFYTTSPTIRVQLSSATPSPMVLDIYATDCHGTVRRCEQVSSSISSSESVGEESRYGSSAEVTFRREVTESTHHFGDRCRLYLPLRSQVTSLRIGIEEGASFTWVPDRLERPILALLSDVEGTSHPSETPAAELERALDIPVISLPAETEERWLTAGTPRLILLEGTGAEARAERLRSQLSCPVLVADPADHLVEQVSEALDLKRDWICPPRTQSRDMASVMWEERHRQIIRRNRSADPDVLIIGNSIMHYWSGLPASQHHRGDDSWAELFDGHVVTNMGVGWDRIENLNWRLIHDELTGCRPRTILLAIGTNNISAGDANDHIAHGVVETAELIRKLQPQARLYVMGILPRRGSEEQVEEINALTRRLLADHPDITYIDGSEGLTKGGKLDETLFRDGLHPNAAGYALLSTTLSHHLDL
jgi:hypothetical protein